MTANGLRYIRWDYFPIVSYLFTLYLYKLSLFHVKYCYHWYCIDGHRYTSWSVSHIEHRAIISSFNCIIMETYARKGNVGTDVRCPDVCRSFLTLPNARQMAVFRGISCTVSCFHCPVCRTYEIATRFWAVVICPIYMCLTVYEFSFI